MSSVFFVDGEFISATDARVPINDLAVLRGYGIFDYTRTYGGVPFHLDANLHRLQNSARLIGLELPHYLDEIHDIVLATLARNAHAESAIRIVVTGGTSSDFITPDGPSRLLVMVSPAPRLPVDWYDTGIRITTTNAERYLPQAKTLNYIPAIVALQQARQAGAVDALYVDDAGYALEATTANLFAFFGDTLVTPAAGVLPGITRRIVLEIAAGQYPVEQRPLTLTELLRADEVFLTSANKEVCPVRQIDDYLIGTPGPRTAALHARFREFAAQARIPG